MYLIYNWASEASPTLGCSIEILRHIYMYVGRFVYDCLWEPIQKMVCQNAWAELRHPNTRMLKVSFVSLKQSAALKP